MLQHQNDYKDTHIPSTEPFHDGELEVGDLITNMRSLAVWRANSYDVKSIKPDTFNEHMKFRKMVPIVKEVEVEVSEMGPDRDPIATLLSILPTGLKGSEPLDKRTFHLNMTCIEGQWVVRYVVGSPEKCHPLYPEVKDISLPDALYKMMKQLPERVLSF